MMLLLVLNVANDRVELRMSVRKSAVAFLPAKPSANPFLLVDEIRGIGFDVSDQIRQGHRWLQSNQNVDVVRHSVDRDQLLAIVSHNSRHVLVKLFLELRTNEGKPPINREHSLTVN